MARDTFTFKRSPGWAGHPPGPVSVKVDAAPLAKIDISVSVPGDERRAAQIAQALAEAAAALLSPEQLPKVRKKVSAWRKRQGLD